MHLSEKGRPHIISMVAMAFILALVKTAKSLVPCQGPSTTSCRRSVILFMRLHVRQSASIRAMTDPVGPLCTPLRLYEQHEWFSEISPRQPPQSSCST